MREGCAPNGIHGRTSGGVGTAHAKLLNTRSGVDIALPSSSSQVWPIPGKCWPKLVEGCPIRSNSGQTWLELDHWTEVDQIWGGVDRLWTDFGRVRHTSSGIDQMWGDADRCWGQKLDHVRLEASEVWPPMPVEFGQTSLDGQIWSGIGRMCPGVGRCSAAFGKVRQEWGQRWARPCGTTLLPTSALDSWRSPVVLAVVPCRCAKLEAACWIGRTACSRPMTRSDSRPPASASACA